MISNLIIRAEIAEPPTEVLPFRDLTYKSKTELKLSVIMEIESSMKNLYYNYCKNRGLLDYIEDLITLEEKEKGLRLTPCPEIAPSIKTDRVTFNNEILLLDKIKFLIC